MPDNRTRTKNRDCLLRVGKLSLDTRSAIAQVGRKSVHLNKVPARLLAFLML